MRSSLSARGYSCGSMVTLANFIGSKPGLDKGLALPSKQQEIQMSKFKKWLRFYNTCVVDIARGRLNSTG